MIQIVDPTFETKRELKNLTLTISHYVDSVSIQLNDKKTGYMVYHKSYSEYDENAIKETKVFINLFDDEKESKSVSGSTKLYFEFINYNW
jgi:hypothetical protein